MKEKLLSLLLFIVVVSFVQCSKKGSGGNNPWQDSIPTAEVKYDNSNFGVYRGVFVGSKGFVTVGLNNNGTLHAQVKVDGQGYDLGTSQNVELNKPVSINFANSVMSFTFSCDADGSNPVVSNIVFAGHPKAQVVMLKALSNRMVDLWQCTYKENAAGGETGIFMFGSTNTTVGLGADDKLNTIFKITGGNIGNHLTLTANMSGGVTTISGDVSADIKTVSGTFSNSRGSGTWTGTRFTD